MLLLFRLYFGYRIHGEVPRHGPCLVVANHSSFLDALFLGAVTPRRMRFVMTDLFANVRGLRWFLRWNRVVLVREEARGSRRLFDEVQRALQTGAAVALFPEGGITRDGELQEFQEGVLAICRRSGVPVVPVGIRGAFRAFPRHRRWPLPRTVSCHVGAPLSPRELIDPGSGRRDAYREGARRLRAVVQRLVRPSSPSA